MQSSCTDIPYEETKSVKGFKYENNYVNDKYYLLLSIISSCQADPFLPKSHKSFKMNACN